MNRLTLPTVLALGTIALPLWGLPAAAEDAHHPAQATSAVAQAQAQSPASPPATSAALSEPTIKALQEALSRQGIAVNADGVLSDATRAAIRRYQSQHHLPVTGEPDKATLDKLGVRQSAAPAQSPTLAQATPPAAGPSAQAPTPPATRPPAQPNQMQGGMMMNCPMMQGMMQGHMMQMMQGMMQMMQTMQAQMQMMQGQMQTMQGQAPGQMGPGQMGPGQMRPGPMQPGQMQPGQMQPGQTRPGGQ